MTAAAGPERVFLHVFSTFRVGGPQVRFAAMANHWGSRYRHLIAAMDNAHDCATRLAGDVNYQLVPVKHQPRRPLASLWRFRRALGRLAPDTLITYNWGATEWALANRGRRCRHIHIEDGFGPEEAHRQLRRRVLFRRLALAGAEHVVLPSRVLERIARDVWRLRADQVLYVPNGVDCAHLAQAPDADLVTRFGLDQAKIVIGTIAGLRAEKNLGRLIRAFAALDVPGARLVIAGDGSERPGLEQLARSLGL